jgi:hypothetical protein
MSSHNVLYPDVPDWLRIGEQQSSRTREKSSKTIVAVNPETGERICFKSLYQAVQWSGGSCNAAIKRAIEKKLPYRGYYWRYKKA